ncbi:MAG: shikimate kinase [Lentibacter algarum]|uniref:shikimate kinase n=1 Tax=Lentibacter algarum TaxID=576131 RepID=UPI0026EB8268|nr:shikimate kinase [Lentibacter algarum]
MAAESWRPMRHTLNKTIVLVGMMGAGKTAVGRALAAKIGAPFLDSDAEIVQAANMSIPEIFSRDGEPFFRARETEVIRRLLNADEKSILSTGGGAFLAEENRSLISDLGVSVFLEADLDLLWSRVGHKDTRPLLRTPNPRATLAEIFEARAPVYARADIKVTAQPEYSIAQMADKVLAALHQRQDVMESQDD